MRKLSGNNKVITEAAINATEETRPDFVYKSIKKITSFREQKLKEKKSKPGSKSDSVC